MKTITNLALGFFLALSVSCRTASHPPRVTPLAQPDYQQFTRELARRSDGTARTNLAPVYPYLAEFIVDRFQLARKQGVGLDIGGGPGNLVLELCQRSPEFYWINTDINTHHAESLFRKALTNDCAPRLGQIFADVHRLPFRDDYADLIVSRGSMPFWQDPPTAFAEIYRVLKPGGHAFIGRGFPPNLPLDVAKAVRARQGKGMPQYDVQETVEQLRTLMNTLKIRDYEILRPRSDQDVVNYGVWVEFSKPQKQRLPARQ